MNNKSDIKYRPDNIRSPYVIYLFLIPCIWVGLKFITSGYKEVPCVTYIFVSLIFIVFIIFYSYIIYKNISNCIYLNTNDREIIGWNVFKRNRSKLIFSDIISLRVKTSLAWEIILTDTCKRVLTINFNSAFVPLLDEILDKAVNCKKIDIDFAYLIKTGSYKGIESIRDKYKGIQPLIKSEN